MDSVPVVFLCINYHLQLGVYFLKEIMNDIEMLCVMTGILEV